MKLPALALGCTALAFAVVDLAHKAAAEPVYFHKRSAAYPAYVGVVLAAWVAAILATRSVSIAVGGGVLAGGAAGNVVSLAVWPGVPNPILVDTVAFNLADVFVVAGFALTAAAILVFALRNRERLRRPVPTAG